MARARNIKPGFFSNEDLVELPFSTRLLFIGLWTIADRAGRLEDKPKRIKMALFPADDLDVDGALDDLQIFKFIDRYEIEGVRYIQVLSFSKHQNPHKDERHSVIPPKEYGASTVQAPCEHASNPADSPILRFSDSPIPDSLPPSRSKTTASPVGDVLDKLGPDGIAKVAKAAKVIAVINADEEDSSPKPKKASDAEMFPGIDPQLVADFKAVRVRKKAALTMTAINGIRREAEKAGIPYASALELCCERGWASFKADWITPDNRGSPRSAPIDLQAAQRASTEEARRLLFGSDDARTIDEQR